MKEKVISYNDEKGLFDKGDKIIVGVSGGKDSVCLLHVLNELKEQYSLSLFVVHVNHGIRGKEADEDAEFVETLASSMNLPYHIENADMKEIAEKKHISVEEAGREERYRIMEMLRTEKDFHKIAVAHHQDDVAETVLFNLIRGTGPRGLSGIAAKRGTVIRPILFADTKEISDYIHINHLDYRNDHTNEQDIYARNIIRLSVFPFLEEKINTKAKAHVADAAGRIALQNEYIEKEAEAAYLRVVRAEDGEYTYEAEEFIKLEKIIRIEVIRLILKNLISDSKNIDRTHYQMIDRLSEKEVGKQVHLPKGIVVQRTYDRLHYYLRKEEIPEEHVFIKKCTFPCQNIIEINEKKVQVHMQVVPIQSALDEIPQKDYTKWIDYDKINNDVYLRNPMEGDYLTLDERGRRKKLSRYFIDKKIPAEQRRRQVVIADGSHIVYVLCSGRMSRAYQVTELTKQVLIVRVEEI